jgi:hypothetical protein
MTNQGDSVLNSKKSSMAFIVTAFSWQKRLENSEFKTILAEPKIWKHANYIGYKIARCKENSV